MHGPAEGPLAKGAGKWARGPRVGPLELRGGGDPTRALLLGPQPLLHVHRLARPGGYATPFAWAPHVSSASPCGNRRPWVTPRRAPWRASTRPLAHMECE